MKTIAALLCSLLASAATALAVDVSTCDQVIGSGDDAVLVTDLSCASPAITLEPGSSLDLNGHTISSTEFAIECSKTCSVVGPGTVNGSMRAARRADVTNVVFDGGGYNASGSRLKATSVTVRNFGGAGNVNPHAIVAKKLFATDVTVENGGAFGFPAILAEKILATNLTVRDTDTIGIAVARGIRASELTVTGNAGFGLTSERSARIDGGNASDNGGDGIDARTVKASGLTATGNGGYGVDGERRVRLSESTLTGNSGGASGADLFSGRKPRLLNTTCHLSDGTSGPWGVCAND